jgi:hypothetical protein
MRFTVLVYLFIFILFLLSVVFSSTRILQVIQKPDTALAWIGLALAAALIFRELAKQQIRGVIALLFGIKERGNVITAMSHGWRLLLVRVGYWFAVGILVIASINLLLGTIQQVRMGDAEVAYQEMREWMQVQQETNVILVENQRATNASIDVLISRIDAQTQRIDKLIGLLEQKFEQEDVMRK